MGSYSAEKFTHLADPWPIDVENVSRGAVGMLIIKKKQYSSIKISVLKEIFEFAAVCYMYDIYEYGT